MKKMTFTEMTKLLLLTSVSVALAACTKSRDPKIADETVAAELISIADLKADGYWVKLGTGAAPQALEGKPVAVNQGHSFVVKDANVPQKLRELVNSALIEGQPAQTVKIRFALRPGKVFMVKQVDNVQSLSAVEAGLAMKGANNETVVPVYSMTIKAAGIIVNDTNDRGEKSYKQKLQVTDLARATHVQLDLRQQSFIPVTFPMDAENMKLRRELFLPTDLQNRYGTVAELEKLLPTKLNADNQDEKILTRLQPSTNPADPNQQLLIYSVKRKSELNAKVRAKLDSGVANLEVAACPPDVQQKSGLGEDCALVLRSTLTAQTVRTSLKRDRDGNADTDIVVEATPTGKGGNLVRITENSVVTEAGPDSLSRLNPEITLRLESVRNKQFLFRRTFEDAASALSVFAPGASGDLQIVKFDLEDHRIVVRKVDTMDDGVRRNLNLEEVMSLPVRYVRLTGPNGVVYAQPKEVEKEEAEVAILDWTKNSLPVTTSPLSYIEAGQCFSSVGNLAVADMDMRLDQGILNFSINGSYAFKADCLVPVRFHDYALTNNLQSVFSLRERISFMAYDPKRDQMSNLDVAFPAQNLMGFGFFTMGQRSRDTFGNYNGTENEKARPAVNDFRNGRVLTYHLGGLPTDAKMKELFIRTTRQVIVDWNEALHRAFAGTELDRAGDYIVLKVDGEAGVTPGHLGDLDRNYIWNFPEALESRTLGMSQPGVNPRTGITEVNNVLMYSGNVMSYIATSKQNAAIIKAYDEMREKLEKQTQLEFAESQKAAAAAQPQTTAAEAGSVGVPTAQAVRPFVDVIRDRANPIRPQLYSPKAAANLKAGALRLQSLRTNGRDLNQLATRIGQAEPDKDYIRLIVSQALDPRFDRSESSLGALTAGEVLKAFGNRLLPEEREALAAQVRQRSIQAKFEKTFNSARRMGCLISGEGIPSIWGKSLADLSVEEIFENWYGKTLSHEIGHSLGLTHNFKGSFDKKNFAYGNDSGDRERHYSSIMDYPSPTSTNYQKPGPYDVYAIRAGYTGLVEVGDQVKKAAQNNGGRTLVSVQNADGQAMKVELKNGAFVSLEDLRNVVIPSSPDNRGKMARSWWKLNAQHLQRFPLKRFEYCHDGDADQDPLCNRWDMGTTPLEVAQFYIQEYQNIYPVTNSRNNRVTSARMGDYFQRVMTDFLKIRGFLDEAFFRALSGDNDGAQSHFMAAFEAYKFFLNVVNTPSMNADVMDPKRFVKVPFQKQVPKTDASGKPVLNAQGEPDVVQVPAVTLVEARASKDLLEPGSEQTSSTIGVELDKVLATQMLTVRSLGSARYARMGLKLSFAELEKYALQMTDTQSLIMRSLRGVLGDNLTPTLFTKDGQIQLPNALTAEITDLVRLYSVLGTSVFLESDTLEDKDNWASLFRIGSSLGQPPSDRLVITKMDQDPKSERSLKFFAFDGATIAQDLVREVAQKRIIIENFDVLTAATTKVMMAQTTEEQNAALAEAQALFDKLNVQQILLSDEEVKAGLNFMGYMGFVSRQLKASLEAIAQLKALLKENKVSEDQAFEVLQPSILALANQHASVAKSVPYAMIADQIVLSLTAQDPVANAIAKNIAMTPEKMRRHVGSVIGNLQTVNKLVIQMNPELNR